MTAPPQFRIEELGDDSRAEKAALCRDILGVLPEWFGIPESVEQYVREAQALPMLIARDGNNKAIAFISLMPMTPATVSAHVLGVRSEWHRRGCGKALFEAAAAWARARGADYLSVKTVAVDDGDPHYGATRRFYEAIGFRAVEVFPKLWSEHNPCLLLVKKL